MDAVIPWARLLALIEPHYPKAGNGRQPLGLEKMLRIYFLQQWFNLSDPLAEDAIYDSESMLPLCPGRAGRKDMVPRKPVNAKRAFKRETFECVRRETLLPGG
jgi:hypothetical protein